MQKHAGIRSRESKPKLQVGPRLWPRSRPGVKVVGVSLRSHLLDEGVRGRAEASVGGEGDGAELDVEVLVLDDLVGGLVLRVGVDVGGGTTCSLTRRLGDVGVDGGVRDADVQNRFAFVVEVRRSQVAFALTLVKVIANPPELGDFGRGHLDACCLARD